MVELRVDPNREKFRNMTGVYVRALRGDKWESVDIMELDSKSIEKWLNGLSKDGLIRMVKILMAY